MTIYRNRDSNKNNRIAGDHTAEASTVKSLIITTTVKSKSKADQINSDGRWLLEYLVAGMLLVIVVAGAFHVILKRRRRTGIKGFRGFRGGESLVEDEDDLLISQMYS